MGETMEAEAAAERAVLDVLIAELRKRSRKALTGDEQLRIRDHVRAVMREKRLELVGRGARRVDDLKRQVGQVRSRVSTFAKKEPVVKTVDKLLFTGGVAWVGVTEYVLLELSPDVMGLWYLCSISPMLAHRVVTYYRAGMIYFCLDFCYFVNALCVACVLARVGPDSAGFRYCFAMANGPLVTAVLVWRNSFVFHDLDRVCSTMLHALPPVWTYALRWGGGAQCGTWRPFRDLATTLTLYALWQVLYIAKTEWLDREHIEKQNEQTSLRWLVRDKKSVMNRLCKQTCVLLRLMRPDDHFDETRWSTKFTFWAAQLVYTVMTLAPVSLMWYSRLFHGGYLILMYTAAIYNGASYYIEVFSSRYNKKFQSPPVEAAPAPAAAPPLAIPAAQDLSCHDAAAERSLLD